jgi:peptide-methionine (R)-S-oxide reductase
LKVRYFQNQLLGGTDEFNYFVENIKITMEKSDEEWKKKLTAEQYRILREKGTERAFTGKFWDHFEDGTYRCAGCESPLFDSKTKYDSSCGWPSFYQSLDEKNIDEHVDKSFGMVRIEVTCKNCGGHLGHIFDDGPQPTGTRFCINSESLEFDKR